jgi:hypothetical protein
VTPIRGLRALRIRALACVSAVVPLLACSVDDRQLQEVSTGGSAVADTDSARAGASPSTSAGADGGHGGTQSGTEAGGNDRAAAGASGAVDQPPIATVDGCPDLDTDGVSDCQETIVTNPDFARDINNWTAQTGATLSWGHEDALSSGNSGSALLVASGAMAATGSTLVAAGQCLTVSGKQLVIAYANALIDEGQDRDGQASLHVAFFDSADCVGNSSSDFTTPAPLDATAGAWLTIQAGSVSSQTTKSARVELALSKPLQSQSFQAHFDNILLEVRPPS